jgi:homogentisate 1,2-dioxygenase
MPYYRCVGDVPRKRHTWHRLPDGSRAAEEMIGQEGFSSSWSLLYHRHSPSAIVAVEPVDEPATAATPDRPLIPRHLRTGALTTAGDVVTGRVPLLVNDDLRIGWVSADGTSPLYRNAMADELVYVQSGRAVVESVFGCLPVGPGDYVVVPRAVTHRWVVTDDEPVGALVLEASGHVGPPRKHLSPTGQLLDQSPYCERDLRLPDGPFVVDGETDVDVLVRNRGGLTRHVHAHHPFDVVGWDGCVYPWVFNIGDFEPIVGRLHQPPPVHQTFEGPGFVVCSFVPRPFDFHPDAVKVPYHHANVDSDEVLFYSAGEFMSRAGSGIGVGSISYHPAGFVHGPQPGSVEASIDHDRTEETAVMVDTFRPLGLTDAARAISDPAYAFTWAGRPPPSARG